jgi:hypothetical protein
MVEITFYQQERKDGGMRMGLQCNGETLLHHYCEGSDDYDPALLWYVDVRCTGNCQGPSTPEEGREWLLQQKDVLQDAIRLATDELSAGLDVDFVPWELQYPHAPDGWEIRVVVSAMRRVVALSIAQKLRILLDHWAKHIENLQRLVPV